MKSRRYHDPRYEGDGYVSKPVSTAAQDGDKDSGQKGQKGTEK